MRYKILDQLLCLHILAIQIYHNGNQHIYYYNKNLFQKFCNQIIFKYLYIFIVNQLYDEKSLVWWAGKQLDKNKKISDYIGKNQKTKIIIKLQKSGGQQPLRQPPVDSKTYQQMVKYYYKKVD